MTALAWAQSPTIKVEGGMIQGVPSAASDVTVFRGIPYAAPPVGDLRWKRPQPVVKWKGVKVADTFSNICWQPGNAVGTFYGNEFYWKENTVQSEDCLYLNVWAPADAVGNPASKLPGTHDGAFHSAELWFMFHTLDRSWRPMTEADYRLADEVMDCWTNFVKYGKPGSESWPPFTLANPYVKTFNVKYGE